MIEVIYNGGLGNNLFQYCFGRILAESLGYQLCAKPIPGFAGTREMIDGKDYRGADKLTLRGQKPNLDFISNGNDIQRHILLTGYFQRYEYYQNHSEEIRDWLQLPDYITYDVDDNAVVLSIRRGVDYIPHYGLPLSFYKEAIENLGFSSVYVCTNEPNDPFVQFFRKRYGATIRAGAFKGAVRSDSYFEDAVDNLVFIKKFKKIVISNSSFAWWAAYLSNATHIIYPRPLTGMWAVNDPISKNIALEVSESRYKYLSCEKYRAEFWSEWATENFNHFTIRVKKLIRPIVRKLAPADQPVFKPYRFEEDGL